MIALPGALVAAFCALPQHSLAPWHNAPRACNLQNSLSLSLSLCLSLLFFAFFSLLLSLTSLSLSLAVKQVVA
jgi:hypothetical protein